MKKLKTYGIYVLLTALTITLISIGSKNNEIRDNGITYVPTPVTETPVAKEEPSIATNVQGEPAEAPQPEPVTKVLQKDVPSVKNEAVAPKAEEPAAEQSVALAFNMPVKGEITEAFSGAKMIFSKTTNDFRTHNGLDISAPEGTDVSAAAYGSVVGVKDDLLWGITVTVDHGGGLLSKYCGLSECFVSEGNIVDYGIVVGKVGNTARVEASKGAHLHFEAIMDTKAVDPQSLFN